MTRAAIVGAFAALALAGCASSGTSTSGPPPVCLSNAPGHLCGDDAKNFCQEMKDGQQVSAQGIDLTTINECAKLGVTGLRP